MIDHRKDLLIWEGRQYAQFHSAPLAGGLFLPTGIDSLDQHLKVPPEVKRHRPGLHAAQLHGSSMVDDNIFDRDYVFFQTLEFNYLHHGNRVVIDRLGEEEGTGSWSLKKLIFEPPRRSRSKWGDDIDWGSPNVILRPSNRNMRPWELDPLGKYVVRGIFLWAIRPEPADLADTEMLRELIREDALGDCVKIGSVQYAGRSDC